jgi:hypothetical protein
MKKYIIGSILGILIVFVSIYCLFNKRQQPIDSIFKAVPLDASIILDIKDYNNLRNSLDKDNPLWKSLSQICFFTEIESKLLLLDSLKNQNPEIKALIASNPQIFISFHPTGKDEFIPVYYIKTNNSSGTRDFKGIINSLNGADITERKYEGEIIRDVILSGNKGKFSCVGVEGLIVISKSSILVENVIRQLGALESVIQKKGLEELVKSAGKNYPANIYVQIPALPSLLASSLHSKYMDVLNFVGNSGGWAEFDLNIKGELMILNGFTTSGKDSLGLCSLFNNQKPQKLELFSKVPSTAISLVALGISNVEEYWINYQTYLKTIGLWKVFAQRRDSIRNKYTFDFKDDFKTIFDSECGIVIMPGPSDSICNSAFSLFRIKSGDDAEKIISKWMNNYSEATGIKPGKLLSEIKIDDEVSFKVFHLPGGNIPAALFGSLFDVTSNEYCLIYDNFLIFGSSPEALKDYISYGILNNTLISDLEFSNMSDNFSSTSNFFFYHKPTLAIDFYGHFFKSKVTDNLNKNLTALNSINSLVYQFSSNGKSLIYNNILVKSISRPKGTSPKALWESKLEGNIISKPVVLSNHTSGETEIFVQDDKNIVYLLNSMGRILWKQNVEEPVLSDIFFVDYYRNHKYQYLFNTRSKLFLIDRIGNPVENYPLTLPEPATNGVAVFDYDKNRKYRIFYAGENRKIYLLDKEGKQQKGWEFKKTEGRVTKPIQHFTNKDKDYLVFNDNNRIYIVNRAGEKRVDPDHNFPLSTNNPVYFIAAKRNQKDLFVASDTTGLIHFINTKGEVTDLMLGRFPSDHFFEVMDVDSDNKADFIFAYGRQLKAFSKDKAEIFSIQTEHGLVYRPIFYEFASNKYKIGVVSPENEKIYLYNTSGNLYKGFPLKGSTQFSVILLNNSENRFNLIVGSDKNFLYNYSVQ